MLDAIPVSQDTTTMAATAVPSPAGGPAASTQAQRGKATPCPTFSNSPSPVSSAFHPLPAGRQSQITSPNGAADQMLEVARKIAARQGPYPYPLFRAEPRQAQHRFIAKENARLTRKGNHHGAHPRLRPATGGRYPHPHPQQKPAISRRSGISSTSPPPAATQTGIPASITRPIVSFP